ncbi:MULTISPECIES: DUF2732 domain-containing protein [Pantoea]|uniref:DUF2732 domain-containing protein n=1 Tax=Pantoea TaxID=53335 RepID=UPI00221F857F|nr:MULTISPECIES: DUF2732 domain-containing protein [Pantoea]MCW0935832.1 DUF2732 domain-containing protein [Pantoea sp. RG18]MDK4216427.1 DUF2732 domain-containing protein [Pantoea agglomerans]
MLNKLSGTTKPGCYIELDMMLNDARREERRGRADLMISRLNILASKIRHEELTCVEAAELLNQEAEKIQAQIEEAH